MSLYQTATENLPIFNSSLYSNSTANLTQSTGDVRYLKLTGGVETGNLTVPNLLTSSTVCNFTDSVPFSQGLNSVCIGKQVGTTGQGQNSVVIGSSSAKYNQGSGSVSIGVLCGNTNQGINSIAIGSQSASQNQQIQSIAIGTGAGQISQGSYGIAIGSISGQNSQQYGAVAIGLSAGQYSQGQYSIAIGVNAGYTNQTAGSICVNASGSILNSGVAGLFVNPIRQIDTTTYNRLSLNTSTNEVCASSGTYTMTSTSAGVVSLSTTIQILRTITSLPIGLWYIGYGALSFSNSVVCHFINDLYDGGGTILFSIKNYGNNTAGIATTCSGSFIVANGSSQNYTMRGSLSAGTSTLGNGVGEFYMYAYRIA